MALRRLRADFSHDYPSVELQLPRAHAPDPDFASLFPIPAGGEAGDIWLSPRMAYLLYEAGLWLAKRAMDGDGFDYTEKKLPEVARPYFRNNSWAGAYEQAFLRLVARLATGLEPRPNCTGEEMALHLMFDEAETYVLDPPENCPEVLEKLQALPGRIRDGDFGFAKECAFEDFYVLMLFHQAQPIHTTIMPPGAVNLHPADWFKPFNDDVAHNHV